MSTVKRPTVYMVGTDGGAIKTDDPRLADELEAVGYRVATQAEYAATIRRLKADERREMEREPHG